MRKILSVLALMLACAPLAFAQDYRKYEGYAGYSYMRTESRNTSNLSLNDVLQGKEDFHGFNASLTNNFARFVGAQFDFGYHARSDDVAFPVAAPIRFVNGKIDTKYFTYMGGLQFKDNSDEAPRFKPFGHVLAGGATQRFRLESDDFPLLGLPDDDFVFIQTSFAVGVGGGIDIKLTDNVDLRVIKVDWVPIFTGDRTVNGVTFEGRTIAQLRLGIGFTFH